MEIATKYTDFFKQRRNIRTRLKRQYLGAFWIIGGGRRQPCNPEDKQPQIGFGLLMV